MKETTLISLRQLWSLIVTSYIWPFEARRELRKGLSQFVVSFRRSRIFLTLLSTDSFTTRRTSIAASFRQYVIPSTTRVIAHSRSFEQYSVVPSKLQSSATCRASETTPLLPDSSVIRTSPDFLEMEVFLQTSLITVSLPNRPFASTYLSSRSPHSSS